MRTFGHRVVNTNTTAIKLLLNAESVITHGRLKKGDLRYRSIPVHI